jgi:hypothetical protein
MPLSINKDTKIIWATVLGVMRIFDTVVSCMSGRKEIPVE